MGFLRECENINITKYAVRKPLRRHSSESGNDDVIYCGRRSGARDGPVNRSIRTNYLPRRLAREAKPAGFVRGWFLELRLRGFVFGILFLAMFVKCLVAFLVFLFAEAARIRRRKLVAIAGMPFHGF